MTTYHYMEIIDLSLQRYGAEHLSMGNFPAPLRKMIKEYIRQPLTNDTIREAVKEWRHSTRDDETSKQRRNMITMKYGHISDWDVSQVTHMSKLFDDFEAFNDDISR